MSPSTRQNDEGGPLSVSEITRKIKLLLDGSFASVTVQGELSNVKRHSSGHMYFTLKDESAQIQGVMWRSRVGQLSFMPEDGMRVVVAGRITVYEVRGQYQIDTTSIRPLGVGELQQAFERLKGKLAAEGLFAQNLKKSLPEYPEHIGIVTSPTGAALQDILHVLTRRFPGVNVIVAPVRVQGAGAAEEIAAAIRDMNAYGRVDVMIVGRGGGSLEDLWAFNEESVARAIAASRIPIISAVGHEVDITIADLVADLRAPTPSAAAEIAVKDRSSLLDILETNWYSIDSNMRDSLRGRAETIRSLLRTYAFSRPVDLYRQHSQRVDELTRSMNRAGAHHLELLSERTRGLSHRVAALDPALALKRGYTIVYRDGRIVGSRALLKKKDAVDIRFHDGTAHSRIED